MFYVFLFLLFVCFFSRNNPAASFSFLQTKAKKNWPWALNGKFSSHFHDQIEDVKLTKAACIPAWRKERKKSGALIWKGDAEMCIRFPACSWEEMAMSLIRVNCWISQKDIFNSNSGDCHWKVVWLNDELEYCVQEDDYCQMSVN